jgi:hypothetical protein
MKGELAFACNMGELFVLSAGMNVQQLRLHLRTHEEVS